MTQSQSFVIKYNSFIFLQHEVSDSETLGRGTRPPNISPGGSTNAFVPKVFHDKSQSFVIKFSLFIFSTTWSQW